VDTVAIPLLKNSPWENSSEVSVTVNLTWILFV
jgi:hypothetical protein